MNKSLLSIVGMLLLCSAIVAAIPGTIDSVKVDGDELFAGDVNKLSLERGQDFEVRVRVTGNAPIANAEIVAFITGVDLPNNEQLSDSSGVFDLSSNNSVVKRLRLTLPTRADKDDYRLRVVFSDRDGEEVVQNYRITIAPPRHSVEIRDVILNPTGSVEAGHSLLASVRMRNLGDRDEDDIKVTVAIPELGLSASDFVSEVRFDESATSEELFFRIPVCAQKGEYPVQVTLEYDDGSRTVESEEFITVTASPQCAAQTGEQPQAIVTITPDASSVMRGEGGSTFTITLTNPSTVSKSYFLTVEGQDGLMAKFSPANALVVGANDIQSAVVFITADEDAPLGTQVLTVSVKDASGKTVRTVPIQVSVKKGSSSSPAASFDFDSGNLVQILGIGLLVLLLILLMVGVYLVFGKPKEPAEKTTLTKTYY